MSNNTSCLDLKEAENFQTIFRVVHNSENPFVMLHKSSLWDKKLSLEAIGVWARLMSKPDNWQVNLNVFSKECDCGLPKIYRVLNELIVHGYAYRFQRRQQYNRFGRVEYLIFESPKSSEEIQIILPQLSFLPSGVISSGILIQPSKEELKDNIRTDASQSPESSPTANDPAPAPRRAKSKILAKEEREGIERALHVKTTAEQHTELITQHGEDTIKASYAYLSDWLESKLQTDPRAAKAHTCFHRLKKWVIPEIITKANGKAAMPSKTAIPPGAAYTPQFNAEFDQQQEKIKQVKEWALSVQQRVDKSKIGRPEIYFACADTSVRIRDDSRKIDQSIAYGDPDFKKKINIFLERSNL